MTYNPVRIEHYEGDVFVVQVHSPDGYLQGAVPRGVLEAALRLPENTFIRYDPDTAEPTAELVQVDVDDDGNPVWGSSEEAPRG